MKKYGKRQKQGKKTVKRKKTKSKVDRQAVKKSKNVVSFVIDGNSVTVDKGKTILEVANELNINIPTLCYHKALSPYGACRLCVVEISTAGQKRIQSSCVSVVREGSVVRTDTSELLNIRRTMMQLILARAPGSEKVMELARKLGIQDTPFVKRDKDCILCGLCIRMCRERMGRNVIGFKGRGEKREIAPPFDVASPLCMSCGACYSVCPTASQRLMKMSELTKKPLLDEFDAKLRPRSVIHIPFPQAVPNAAVIDREHCVHFTTDQCRICEDFCEPEAIDFEQKDEIIDLSVGSIVFAGGSEVFNGKNKREYGNGRYKNIVTSLEFERILSASGPYHGHIVRPGDQKEPRRIAFVQCVGSRDDEYPYCSSVCCMYATKEALIAMEHSPGLECSIFYMDMRAFGKGFDQYYEKARQTGVRYVRCRPSVIEEISETDNLTIKYHGDNGAMHAEEFDMVVLSCGLHPAKDFQETARNLGLRLNSAGFCATKALAPTHTNRQGIYVCGPCTEPKDIPETVTQASAAASSVMELLAEKRHSLIAKKEYPQEIDVSGQEPRIGVFICHCGINIGAYVNVDQVVQHAKELRYVVHAEDNLYTCSQDSQKRIVEMIKKHGLNRVVVASCTPRTHEPLFRETIQEAGLNPYLFEMTNIRDQCSWIHMSHLKEATAKAKDLVGMSVSKVAHASPLKRVEIDVIKKALVIGGGIAGMVSSISLARQGFEVCLVEKEEKLGGHARYIYYTLEGEDVQTFLNHLIEQVTGDKRIQVLTRASITSVTGFIGNYETEIAVSGGKAKKYRHGVVIVATGAQEHKPAEYLYGHDKRVVTQQDLEESLVNKEHIKDKNGQILDMGRVSSVVMIQCVGSRDDGCLYCSRRCCSQAIKNAMKLLERNREVKIYVLYRDVRTYGFKEDFYTKARERGVMFIRYDADTRPAVKDSNESLEVTVFDPILQDNIRIKTDLVVLSTGIAPNPENEEIAKMLKVPLNSDGYFLEAHVKLRPVDFATEGIFVAGLAHSPKFISETISQASAVAARASTILANDKYYAEATVSFVNDELCVGCAMCSSLCPYEAIEMTTEDGRRLSHVNEALCKGCGTCAATCPSGAMDQYGFTRRQIMAMIDNVKGW